MSGPSSGIPAASQTVCMFPLIGRKAKLEKEIKLLKLNVVDEVKKFTRDVSEIHGMSTRRIAQSTVLASGAFSFFVYAFDQACRSFYRDAEIDTVLSEIISDASLADLANIHDSGTEYSEAGGLRLRMTRMNSHLAKASSLLGTKLEDRTSALWLAAVVISAESDPTDETLLVYVVQSRLLLALIRLSMAKRVAAIVALMR